MKFSVPASITYTGWIEIEAKNLEEAKEKGSVLHNDGIALYDIKDAEYTSEVMVSEIEEIKK